MKRKLALLLALAVFCLAILTACTSTPPKAPDGGNTTPGGSSGTTGTPGGDGKSAKDTLVIGHYMDPPNLDPNNSLNDAAMRITTNIYDTLIRMDGNFKPQPYLAESWTISEDGMTYTFKIREGVKWHNGDTFTVEDVVFSIERGIAMPKASPVYNKINGAKKVDDLHVEVYLKSPYAQILSNLALPFGPIVNKKYVESMSEEEFGTKPMGTGPYKFVDWKKGEKITLERYDDYFMGPAGIKTVEWVVIPDSAAAMINMQSGDLDAYVDINPSDYATAKTSDKLKINEGSALGYDFVQFNCEKPPFDKIEVRQAVMHCVDREGILNGVNDGIGFVTDTFVLEGAKGYTDDFRKYGYDLEKAKALLKSAGLEGGFECEIIINNAKHAKYAQVLQNDLAKIGVTAKIKQEEPSAYKVTTRDGNYGICINSAAFTAMDLYEACYDSVDENLIGTTNSAFYRNARVTELLNTAIETVDQDKVAGMYEETIKILAEEVPLCPILWRMRNVCANKDLVIPFIDPYGFSFVHEWTWS